MGGLIETLLGGLLGGILALLGVWLAGWQERKRGREAKEARKEEMLYEKQLAVLEEVVKGLHFRNIEWKKFVGVHEKLLANELSKKRLSEKRLAVLEEEEKVIAQKMVGITKGSIEMMAKSETYLPLETVQAFQECLVQTKEIVEGLRERMLQGEDGDVEGTKEQLDFWYMTTVLKMREHLGIKASSAS